MRFLVVLLMLTGVAYADLEQAREHFRNRDYSGPALDNLYTARALYEAHLGEISQIDVFQKREQVKQTLRDEGVRGSRLLKQIDTRLHQVLQPDVERLSAKLKSNLVEIREYADLLMFIGDSIDKEIDKEAKAAVYNKCIDVTDLTARAYGIYDLQNMKKRRGHQKETLLSLQTLDREELQKLGGVLYMRAACLGAWGLTGVVSRLTTGKRIPAIQANLALLTSLNVKSLYNYGPYRVIGRVASKAPTSTFGKDPVRAIHMLREAFIKTKLGNDVSVYGYNNTYYAEAMKSLAKDLKKKAKRLKEKGEQLIAEGKIEEGQAKIDEANLKTQQASLQNYKAVQLLKLFVATDINTLNPGFIPENRRALVDANNLLRDWGAR